MPWSTEHITSSGRTEKFQWSKVDGNGLGVRKRSVLSDQNGRDIVVQETGQDVLINIVGHSEGIYQQSMFLNQVKVKGDNGG